MPKLSGVHRYVARYIEGLEELRGKVVVDVPCGDGRSSALFHARGAQVRAFDLYPEAMRVEGLQAQYADLADGLPLPDASADVLICQEGIEHMPDKVAVLAEFNRVLKPGGTLLLTAPSISNARSRVSMFLTESDFWRRTPPTEMDSVWATDDASGRVYFGHLFLVGVQHLMTVCKLSGFSLQQSRRTKPSNTSVVLGVLLYPWLALATLLGCALYDKRQHVDARWRRSILWERAKLNLSPTTLFCRNLFWVLRKDAAVPEVIAELKARRVA